MFDKINITPTRTETHFVDRNVTVNRAPTDESVKLLKEFETAAGDKIVERFLVDTNELKCVGFYIMDEYSGEKSAVVKFVLNDTEYKKEIRLSIADRLGTREEIARKTFKQISEWIARDILMSQKNFIKWVSK